MSYVSLEVMGRISLLSESILEKEKNLSSLVADVAMNAESFRNELVEEIDDFLRFVSAGHNGHDEQYEHRLTCVPAADDSKSRDGLYVYDLSDMAATLDLLFEDISRLLHSMLDSLHRLEGIEKVNEIFVREYALPETQDLTIFKERASTLWKRTMYSVQVDEYIKSLEDCIRLSECLRNI